MTGPTDAITDADGFRIYRWPGAAAGITPEQLAALIEYAATEPVDVLSVTSIRRACGETFPIVNWQITNILDVATGMEKAVFVGPRGGVSEKRVSTEWPPAFLAKLVATEGNDEKLMKLRQWWRERADQPRDRPAVRGTLVHSFIEHGYTSSQIDYNFVDLARGQLDARDRKKMAVVTDQDVLFINRCMWQYEHMRRVQPFVILAREPQVWNLTVGYSGSADALFWFLPEGTSPADVAVWQERADEGNVTLADIEKVGGDVVLGDWKTSKDVHTDQVVQVTAYMSAEFIGEHGIIDVRLTEMIRATRRAALVNIRPNGWGVYEIAFRGDVLAAFLGSVQLARFLVTNPKPQPLFTRVLRGNAADEEVS